jgi:hypothetical protein
MSVCGLRFRVCNEIKCPNAKIANKAKFAKLIVKKFHVLSFLKEASIILAIKGREKHCQLSREGGLGKMICIS